MKTLTSALLAALLGATALTAPALADDSAIGVFLDASGSDRYDDHSSSWGFSSSSDDRWDDDDDDRYDDDYDDYDDSYDDSDDDDYDDDDDDDDD